MPDRDADSEKEALREVARAAAKLARSAEIRALDWSASGGHSIHDDASRGRLHWYFEQCSITLGVGVYAPNRIESVVDVAVQVELPPVAADLLDRVLP